MGPIIHTTYGFPVLLLSMLWWFRCAVIDWLPSVELKEHDIYSRLIFAWFSRYRPKRTNYASILYQNPATFTMACYVSIESDPLDIDDDEMFFFPTGLTVFEYEGYYFILRESPIRIYAIWFNNKPVKMFVEKTLNKYLRDDRMRQYTPQDDTWSDLLRPRRLMETYHHEELSGVMEDVRSLFEGEAAYARVGKKWKRVLLAHGAPGTGKTTMGDVIASELNVPLYTLATGSTDTEFRQLIKDLRKRTVVVLNEVDQLDAAQRREGSLNPDGSQRQPIKKQTLMSWLSGDIGTDGVYIILTTNHREVLDDTVCRPGRVDRELCFPAEMTKETVTNIIRVRYESKEDIKLGQDKYPGRTPSDVQQFLDGKDYEFAVEHIEKWLLE
ncbi:hypothetical protein LRP88_14916 [Fusarium phalaenopsidis]